MAIHKAGYVHSNLKQENIIIDSEKKEPMIVDLEMYNKISSEDDLIEGKGTPGYMAPEVMCR